MATPTKRRKPNNYKSSPPAVVGSLDFFFGKQKKATCSSSNAHTVDGVNQESFVADSTLQDENIGKDARDQTLTDEEFARKLQLEWDREGRDHNNDDGAVKGIVSKAGFTEDDVESSNNLNPRSQVEFQDRFREVATQDIPASKTGEAPESPKPDTLALQSVTSTGDTISSTIPFDESPLTFDPSEYLPDLKNHWAKEGGDASYGLLTRCFVLVNSTQSRIRIVDTLVNFLRIIIEGDPASVLPAVNIFQHVWRYVY